MPAAVLVLSLAALIASASLDATHRHAEEAGEAPGLVIAWSAIALALVAGSSCARLGRSGRRSPASIAPVLAVLVAVFGVESSVHSTHHLTDADAAASCVVLAASVHVAQADGPPAPAIGAPAPAAGPAPALPDERPRPLEPFLSFEGRAPPSAVSA